MSYFDLHFPFKGSLIPSDHGYALYGAISRIVPEAHKSDWLSIDTIPGISQGNGLTEIDKLAKLKLRLPGEQMPLILKLVGKQLALNGYSIQLGAPQVFPLKPSRALYSRIVTIKGYTEPDIFYEAVQRKLSEINMGGEIIVGPRRKVKIGGHIIIGFALAIGELIPEESIQLQIRGIGGRRHVGCGVFFPMNPERVAGMPPQQMGNGEHQ